LHLNVFDQPAKDFLVTLFADGAAEGGFTCPAGKPQGLLCSPILEAH
jgi:hypothetical protein